MENIKHKKPVLNTNDIVINRKTKIDIVIKTLCRILVERKYTRELPIEAKYIGTSINSSLQERVQVNWKGQQEDQDEVWLLSPDA